MREEGSDKRRVEKVGRRDWEGGGWGGLMRQHRGVRREEGGGVFEGERREEGAGNEEAGKMKR